MKRVLALVGAIGMVAAAFVIRDQLDGGGGGGNGGGGGDVQLVCATELADACARLAEVEDGVAFTVEDAADTVARLASGGAAADGVDGWVTFGPWPEMANVVAGDQVVGEGGVPVASSPVHLLFPEGSNLCLADPGWRCLGTQPSYRVGMRPPDAALGAVLYGAAVAGFFGSTDVGTNEIAADDEFPGWSRRLLEHASADPLGALLRVYPPTAVFDALPLLGVEVETRVLPSRAAQLLRIVDPEPRARAEIVIAPVRAADGASRVEDLARSDRVTRALLELGWEEPADDPTGLPPAGLLVALAQLS